MRGIVAILSCKNIGTRPMLDTRMPAKLGLIPRCLPAAWALLIGLPAHATGMDLAAQTAAEIRAEAVLTSDGPAGHPLPLAASWNTGTLADGYDPDYQLGMIGQGHHLLPWFQLDPPRGPRSVTSLIAYYRKPLLKCAELDLPVSFISTQWESLLADTGHSRALPAASNPNVVNRQGAVLPMVSPFGPVEAWAEAGRQWTASKTVGQLQAWHTHPPKLVFVSNNEQPKLAWKEAGTDQRYFARQGGGTSDEAKRKAVGDGWIERYRALQDGMRGGLANADWAGRSVFVGYDAFGGSSFGRWDGWVEYSLHTKNRIDPWPLAWDGASVSFYVNDWEPATDHTVWSPQIQSMNWVFMQQEARRLNPGFWFEMSVWDGYQPGQPGDKRALYAKQGRAYTPQRHAGMARFGMWLLRPRVVREYRNAGQTRADTEAYFLALVNAVDEIHANPVLASFWRQGRLVANPAHEHPYRQAIPPEYASVPRWFLLDSETDPQRPWALDTEIPVYSLALVKGGAPRREWLVFVQSPKREYANIRLELPGYGPLTVDSKPSGNYYWVKEDSRSARLLDGLAG